MTEVKGYFSNLKKNIFLGLVVCLVFILAAIFYTFSQKTTFEATATLYVNRAASPASDKYYTFEGYYSGQAAKEYTDVVLGILKTPDLAIEGLKLANSKAVVGDFLGSLKVKKVGPQLIG